MSRPSPSPSPSLSLLHSHVRTILPGDPIEPKVVPLSRPGGLQLFGFDGDDEVANSMVPDLVLGAHIALAPNLSFLTLRGGGSSLFTSINTVDNSLIVISSTLPNNHHREVFLIFDTIDRSLRMIPAVPRAHRLNRTNRVLAVRHDGDQGPYSLVIPGEVVTSFSDEGFPEWHDVLFISPSSPTSPSSSTSPPSPTLTWHLKKMANFPKPQLPDVFFADEVFSFRGRAYWADLLCGVMYCDCADVLSDGVDPVDFHFFTWPSLQMTNPLGREVVAELRAFRTMGCVQGSIKFVSIDGFISRMDASTMMHRHVRIWRLKGDSAWNIEDKLSMNDLWHMPGFLNLQRQYPKYRRLAPMYPFLSPKEDRVIYFALGEFKQGKAWGSFPTTVHFLLRVDICLQDVSFIQIPYSPRPTVQDYFGFDHSMLCPPVALSGDGKSKPLALQALSVDGKSKLQGLQALSGDGKSKPLALQALSVDGRSKLQGLQALSGDGKSKPQALQAKMKGLIV